MWGFDWSAGEAIGSLVGGVATAGNAIVGNLLSTPIGWEGLGSILGAVGTIAAIFGATWRISKERQFEMRLSAIKDLRADALEIERSLTNIDRDLSEGLLSNRGLLIAEEIVLISAADTCEDIARFLNDPANFNLIISAIFRAEAKDTAAIQLIDKCDGLIALADRHRQYFPVLSRALNASVTSAGRLIRLLLGAGLMRSFFEITDETQDLREMLQTRVIGAGSVQLATARMGDLFGNALTTVLQGAGQKRYNLAEFIAKQYARFIVQAREPKLHKMVINRRRNEKRFFNFKDDRVEQSALQILKPTLDEDTYTQIKKALDHSDKNMKETEE